MQGLAIARCKEVHPQQIQIQRAGNVFLQRVNRLAGKQLLALVLSHVQALQALGRIGRLCQKEQA